MRIFDYHFLLDNIIMFNGDHRNCYKFSDYKLVMMP